MGLEGLSDLSKTTQLKCEGLNLGPASGRAEPLPTSEPLTQRIRDACFALCASLAALSSLLSTLCPQSGIISPLPQHAHVPIYRLRPLTHSKGFLSPSCGPGSGQGQGHTGIETDTVLLSWARLMERQGGINKELHKHTITN